MAMVYWNPFGQISPGQYPLVKIFPVKISRSKSPRSKSRGQSPPDSIFGLHSCSNVTIVFLTLIPIKIKNILWYQFSAVFGTFIYHLILDPYMTKMSQNRSEKILLNFIVISVKKYFGNKNKTPTRKSKFNHFRILWKIDLRN